MRPDTWHLFIDPGILRFFAEGLMWTVLLSITSIALSFAVGLLFALGRLSTRAWLRWPSIAYVEGVRAVPVLLLIVYFSIKGSSLFQPFFGEDFDLPRFWAGVLGLSMYTSAIIAEILRAGILALPRGQSEAARALGLSYPRTMRFVVLPQALRAMVPALMAQLTTIIKDTSLVGTIGFFELYRSARIIYTQNFNPIEALGFISIIYFVICFTLSQLSRRLELGQAPKDVRAKLAEIQLRDQVA